MNGNIDDLLRNRSDIVPSQVFIDEAIRCVEEGKKQGIILRLMGALAVRIHSLEFKDLHRKLSRLSAEQEFSDIDFMSYNKFFQKMPKLFGIFGYSPNKVAQSYGHIWASRHIYDDLRGRFHIDVFFDKLDMCHTIDFRKRLEGDYPTIPLAELLLEKMQIVKINEKDIKDSIILIRAHNAGEMDKETINVSRIASILAKNWGFWYTVTTNLNVIKNCLPKYASLTETDIHDVTTKVDYMLKCIEEKPKSVRWKIRAKIGAKKRWYTQVEEPFLVEK